MKAVSKLYDSRIEAWNILVEISIGEYEGLIKDIISKNEFQRKKVRSSRSVYALLKEDLLKNCVIPPIVLALTQNFQINDENDFTLNEAEFTKTILSLKDHLVILDGLQRTYTILELLGDLKSDGDEANLEKILETKIRAEIYVGLNRLGILYRMLTLNTGQTPMSLRHQIEILYLDYAASSVHGIELLREIDGRNPSAINQYNFRDVVEGFNAYLDRDELPFDKDDLLENISSLEKLSKENQGVDLFANYLGSLHEMVSQLEKECSGSELSAEYIESKGTPFGKNISQIFKRPQSLSGFGAAIGKLFDFEILKEFEDLNATIKNVSIGEPQRFLEDINDSMDWLKNNSKKIGNAQRSFFAIFFRELLNRDTDSFGNPINANKAALRKYQSQNT